MLDTEKEACLILDEASATLSLAYYLVKRERVKRVVPAVQNELISLRDVIGSIRTYSFDPTKVDALVTENVGAGSSQPSTKLSLNLGSAALDLACAKVNHAVVKLGLRNPWGMDTIAPDNLNKLTGVLYALAREEDKKNFK